MDLEPPRLQDALEARANERKVRDREAPDHILALARRQRDFLQALELQQRSGDARDRIAREQEQRRLSVDRTFIVSLDRHLDRAIGSDDGRRAAKIAERKAAV